MSQTIILKKSAVAGKVPQAGDLEVGEVAINMADRILYFKDSSGEVVAVKGEAVVELTQAQVEDGASEITGTISGSLLWKGAKAWLASLIIRTGAASGYYASKELNFRQLGNSGAEQACALRVASEASGIQVVGGWTAGIDVNYKSLAGANTDKIYGVGSYFQFESGSTASKVLGSEVIINSIAPTATIGDFVGYLVPDLSAVPNIDRVQNFHCFASEMPNAPIRIRGPYLRLNSSMQIQELAPSRIGVQTAQRQWCTGKVMYAEAAIQALPAGVVCVGAIFLAKRSKLTQLGIYLGQGAAGQGKLAVYRQSPQGFLGVKLWESGNISTIGNGNKTASPNIVLESGLYLVAFLANSAVGVRAYPNSMAGDIFGAPDLVSVDCVPYYHLGAYPSSLPADVSTLPPTGLLAPVMPDFNYLLGEP